MAWNNSNGGTQDSKLSKAKRKSPNVLRGLFAAIIVVAVGFAVMYCFKPEEEQKVEESKKPTAIAETEADLSEPETNVAEEVEVKVDPNARPTRLGEKVNGYVLLPNGEMHKILGESHLMPTKDESSIFDYPSDNIIANILTLEPGETLVGTPNYNGRFTRGFLKSLNSPIIVSADDPEEVKELKRAVNEAKIELKAAYDRGEDIEEMIIKAREEFRDLATYKQDLRKELLRYANREATSEQDVDDYMKAANIMLEQKGIAPIDDIPFAKIKLKMKEGWEGSNE